MSVKNLRLCVSYDSMTESLYSGQYLPCPCAADITAQLGSILLKWLISLAHLYHYFIILQSLHNLSHLSEKLFLSQTNSTNLELFYYYFTAIYIIFLRTVQ